MKVIIVCSIDHSSLKLHFIAAASLYFSAVPSLPTQDKTYKNASNAHFVLLRLERMMASLNRDFNQDQKCLGTLLFQSSRFNLDFNCNSRSLCIMFLLSRTMQWWIFSNTLRFWRCLLKVFQKTNEIFSRISALASKKRSNQKNKGTLYHFIPLIRRHCITHYYRTRAIIIRGLYIVNPLF